MSVRLLSLDDRVDERRISDVGRVVVFGVALALTLHEFAMWLRLADVYWSPEGIESIKVSAFVAALLGVYAFGAPFFRAVLKDLTRRG